MSNNRETWRSGAHPPPNNKPPCSSGGARQTAAEVATYVATLKKIVKNFHFGRMLIFPNKQLAIANHLRATANR